MNTTRTFFLCATLLSGIVSAAADQKPLLLSGSSYVTGDPLNLEQAKSQSNVMLLGTVTDLGNYDFRGKNLAVYSSVIVDTSTVYLGTTESSIKLRIALTELKQVPARGSQYVFFIREKEHRNYVVGFLPATDDNIAKVKALTGTAPTPN